MERCGAVTDGDGVGSADIGRERAFEGRRIRTLAQCPAAHGIDDGGDIFIADVRGGQRHSVLFTTSLTQTCLSRCRLALASLLRVA